MNEKTKDSDKGAEAQRFSPTDWDWVMLLSGEINTIETRFDTVATMLIGVSGMTIAVLIAFMGIAYSNYNSMNPSIIIICIMFLSILPIIFLLLQHKRIHKKRSRRDGDRVKLLKGCRDEIFDRLDDPNKIYERCFEM